LVGVGDPDGRSAARKPVATVRHLGEPEEASNMTTTRDRRLPLLGGLAPVVGLLVVSPIAAEYLSGYQVFNPLVLLGYLGIFIPLYGTVAVLIREITRRTGRDWPTILLLGAAFGLIQAGPLDQSLFNPATSTTTTPPGRRPGGKSGRPPSSPGWVSAPAIWASSPAS
jgi:hypothetical protein